MARRDRPPRLQAHRRPRQLPPGRHPPPPQPHMLDRAAVVIAAGGRGIPVVRGRDGQWRGIEAVIDKDFASSLLASELNAEMYVVLTGVAKVSIDYEKPSEKALDRMTVAEATR